MPRPFCPVESRSEVGNSNPRELFDADLGELTEQVTTTTLDTWGDRLEGTEVFVESHAETMVEALRGDYSVLGPPEELDDS